MDYQRLLPNAEERATELLATNQQLTATLADVPEKIAKLASIFTVRLSSYCVNLVRILNS